VGFTPLASLHKLSTASELATLLISASYTLPSRRAALAMISNKVLTHHHQISLTKQDYITRFISPTTTTPVSIRLDFQQPFPHIISPAATNILMPYLELQRLQPGHSKPTIPTALLFDTPTLKKLKFITEAPRYPPFSSLGGL